MHLWGAADRIKTSAVVRQGVRSSEGSQGTSYHGVLLSESLFRNSKGKSYIKHREKVCAYNRACRSLVSIQTAMKERKEMLARIIGHAHGKIFATPR